MRKCEQWGRRGREGGEGEIEGGKENIAEKRRTREGRGMEDRRGMSTEEKRDNEGRKGEGRIGERGGEEGETIRIAG